jgi:hypothetical protein
MTFPFTCSISSKPHPVLRRGNKMSVLFKSHPVWLIVILLFMVTPQAEASQTYPIFDTAGWLNTQLPGRLLIRGGMSDENIFLTMRDEFEQGNKHRAVYEYDPKMKSLQKVPDSKWDGSMTPITECASKPQKPPDKFKGIGEKLYFDNQEVPIKGAVLISSSYSPSGKAVAILSAAGPRKGSLMPFLGGGQNSNGQHYHQLFSVANGKPIGAVVKILFTTEKQAYPVCWSIDEKYVFYASLLADKLTIVETNSPN